MKKVLLLGDSIRMGYDSIVKEMLGGDYQVYYDDTDNGRFSFYTLWQANQFFWHYGHFDVVHWNNGYWDMNAEPPMNEPLTPIGEYQHNLRRIIRLCRANCDRLIFATTLPVTGPTEMHSYGNDSVLAYNKAALEVMAAENVEVNDLYTRMLQRDDLYKCEDTLHLTEEGSRVCAEQIVRMIRAAE